MTDLVLILGDQLTPNISSLGRARPEDTRIVMAEVADEARYIRHHVRKIAFTFSAMRHFREELQESGWAITYFTFETGLKSLREAVERTLEDGTYQRLIITEPGEWRLRAEMQTWSERLGLPVLIVEDQRFLASHDDFARWADGRKQLRMEYFYREMRKRTGLLMDGAAPAGGQWNFDKENRKPAEASLFMPQRFRPEPDAVTKEVLDLVARAFADHPGHLEGFDLPVTRAEAERSRDHFMRHALPGFGDYQDAMLTDEPLLYHSNLSTALNAGLLDPDDLCHRAETEYHEGRAPLNAVEGFIRQILGWREFVRGIYWREGPDYVRRNALGAQRPLPGFYWTGDTDMRCLSQAIGQTLELGYAHHIQRLMVTGLFAMLAGVDPFEVHEWYLAVYTDAYEWVEAPNVVGMSQFADGGLLGSKPYAASGAYIDRMSDYCADCKYDVKQKTGPKACPFNALYWDFLARNEERLRGNPRLGPVYRNWDRMDEERQIALRDSAGHFLNDL